MDFFFQDENLTTKPSDVNPADSGFLHAFIAAFSVIIVSELGDKTVIINFSLN
jgi:putative Ca2+/H+ antiporter (TMEM165/GDT1 family)